MKYAQHYACRGYKSPNGSTLVLSTDEQRWMERTWTAWWWWQDARTWSRWSSCSRLLDVVRVVVAKEKQVEFHLPVINVVAWDTERECAPHVAVEDVCVGDVGMVAIVGDVQAAGAVDVKYGMRAWLAVSGHAEGGASQNTPSNPPGNE